jgi:hypothetical protein
MVRLRFTDGLRALAAGLVLIVFCAGARAEDAAGCKALAWPLDQERAAFASDKLESVSSGAARGPWKEQTLALKLAPQESVAFAVPTGGKRKPKGKVFGGTLSFDAPAQAERYYVTLSSEGWIDVAQNGAGIKSDAHTSAKDCPGVRKHDGERSHGKAHADTSAPKIHCPSCRLAPPMTPPATPPGEN